MNGKNPIIALAALAWLWTGAPARAESLPPIEKIIAQFEEVVFKTEHGAGKLGKPLVRWRGPIVARLHGAKAKTYKRDVQALFKELSNLTGQQFRIVAPNTTRPVNFDIRFVTQADVTARTGKAGFRCWGTMKGSRSKAAITYGEVLINTDTAFRAKHCIVEEITQLMGLPNDTPIIADSIFNEASKRTSLSLADKVLIRTLYDKRLKPGMSAKQAMPIVKNVVGALRNRLINAIKKLR